MFVRHCWRPQSVEEVYDLIDSHPWAVLISNGDDGPFATNLPLLLDRSRVPHGVLTGHIARANEHSRIVVASEAPVLAIFHGPSSHITPSWYPDRDMPGTYYYTAAHCYGRTRCLEEPKLEATLEKLNDRLEASVPDGWNLNEIPHSEITRRLPGIVGFELEIERIEGKFKLGQDEPRRDALAVADRLAASTDPVRRALGEAVRRANEGRPDDGSA